MKKFAATLLASLIAILSSTPDSAQAIRMGAAQISSQIASPVASAKAGLWWDGSTLGPLWRRVDGSDLRLQIPKLQTVYNAGASSSDSTILLDSTRVGVTVQDTNTPLTVPLLSAWNNGGTIHYLDVIGTGVLTSGLQYPGLRVYQNINAWNGNTLFLGSDRAQTTAVVIGANVGGFSPVDVTIGNNLTVTNNLTV